MGVFTLLTLSSSPGYFRKPRNEAHECEQQEVSCCFSITSQVLSVSVDSHPLWFDSSALSHLCCCRLPNFSLAAFFVVSFEVFRLWNKYFKIHTNSGKPGTWHLLPGGITFVSGYSPSQASSQGWELGGCLPCSFVPSFVPSGSVCLCVPQWHDENSLGTCIHITHAPWRQ